MTAIVMLFASQVFAADNSIYIDQTGDNSVITMLQDGATKCSPIDMIWMCSTHPETSVMAVMPAKHLCMKSFLTQV